MDGDSLHKILLWLVASTRGGPLRAKIIQAIGERPMNAHQLAKLLNVDYSTIRHHLGILIEHGIAERVGGDYASAYFLSSQMMQMYPQIEEVFQSAKGDNSSLVKRLNNIKWSESTG